MKTSKTLLIIVAGFIIILLVISLVVLRKDIGTLMEKQALIEYELVPVEEFASIDFSSNWIVQVKQGKDCKLELAMEEDCNLQPKLENNKGTLFLTAEATPEDENTGNIYARVTAPILYEIKARGNTEIVMKNFWSDSINVILEDSSKFSGKNNDFANINFKASDYD
jgi:hypothetical protein